MVVSGLSLAGILARARQGSRNERIVIRSSGQVHSHDHLVYKEKEIVREIVKVPCDYCGTLVEVTSPKCPSCGAPLKR